MFLRCRGAGSPTVVLVSGYHVAANAWSLRPPGSKHTPVLPAVARSTRVCAYDRPGTIRDAGLVSRSDPVPMPRTAEDAVKELHALLRAARVPGPYVLAGHSLGGLIVRLYAGTYPRQVAGLVLIDAVSEKLEPLLGPEQWATYAGYQFVPVPGFEDYRDAETFDFTRASPRRGAQQRRGRCVRRCPWSCSRRANPSGCRTACWAFPSPRSTGPGGSRSASWRGSCRTRATSSPRGAGTTSTSSNRRS